MATAGVAVAFLQTAGLEGNISLVKCGFEGGTSGQGAVVWIKSFAGVDVRILRSGIPSINVVLRDGEEREGRGRDEEGFEEMHGWDR
jgi:hypothetical protein